MFEWDRGRHLQFLPTSQIAEGFSGIVYSCVQSSALNVFQRYCRRSRGVSKSNLSAKLRCVGNHHHPDDYIGADALFLH